MISLNPRHLILQLLLWNSYFIGHAASCGVNEELIRQRRRELQEKDLWLDEVNTQIRMGARALEDAPSDTPLLFDGTLLNDLGEPMENAQVQFWHADSNGKYFHPGDDLDGFEYQTDTFSYFGTATVDSDGAFHFKTYRPGIYLSRPITHIHFKVFFDGEELLTSQFYFSDENVERFFDEMLILTLEDDVDADGNAVKKTQKEVVANMGLGGDIKLTPRDMEGPFYPLVDFFEVGNDMTEGLPLKFTTGLPTGTFTAKPNTTESSVEPTLQPTIRPSNRPVLLVDFVEVEGSVEDLVDDFIYFEDNSTNATNDDDVFDDYDEIETDIRIDLPMNITENDQEFKPDTTANDEDTAQEDSSTSLSLLSNGIRYLRKVD